MSTMMTALGLNNLTGEEKSRLFLELQEELTPIGHGGIPLSDAQREELHRRLADIETNPEDWIPWEDVRAEVRSRYQP